MSSPSAFERRGGPQGATGPTGPAGPSGPTGPPSPAIRISGNTSGATALISTGTATLAGGNNITLSQAGNAITISGGAGGAETQTAISGIANSQTTYTSGTVSLSELGALTIRSTTGNQFQLSVPATSSLSATGAVSISTNGSTVSIGAPVQTAQTGISGIANSQTTYTSGTVSLSELGAVTIRSTTGNQFQISVNSQSVQPETQTFIAGVSASDTLYTSGNVRLTGVGGGVTVSSNTGQRVDISVAAQSVQPETQTFVGGISASDTVYTSGTVKFTGVGGGITVSSNTGQRVDLSVAAPVAQTNQAGSVYASSNTFGTSSGTYDARTLSIAGAGAVSVAASNSGFVISVPAVVAQTNQSGNVYASSNTFGTSSGTYDARSISIAGSGAVGVAASNSGFVISAPSQTNQAGSVYGVSNTSGTSSGTYDARTLSIAGAGLVTVAASNSGWRIDATSAAQTNQAGSVYAISNTQGTSSGTYDARTLSIAGEGIVTVAASNSGWRISASQSTQLGSVYASSNTFGTSSGTYNAKTLSIAGSGAVSVAASNSGWVISAPVQTEQTQSRFNLTLSGNSTSGGAGFIQISSGVMTLAGGPNITLSQAGNAVSISAPAAGAGQFSAGVSTGGNTAGSTGITGTQMVLVGSSPISLSQSTGANGGTVTINAPATSSLSATGAVSISTNASTISIGAPTQTNQAGSVYAISNTSGTSSGTYDARTLSIAGMGKVSVAASNSGWRINVPDVDLSYRWIESPLQPGLTQGIATSGATNTTLSAWVMPMTLPQDLNFNNLYMAASNSFTTATTSISSINHSYSQGASLGFYSLTGSTMSLVTSFSNSLGYSNATAVAVGNMSITARVGFGGSSTTKSTQGGANNSAIVQSISGLRKLPMVWTTKAESLSGGQYWAVGAFSALTGGNNQVALQSVGFVSGFSAWGSAMNPPDMMANTASVTSPYPFLGMATLVASTDSLMPVSFDVSKITTATAIANSTAFQSLWVNIYSSHLT